ncbi:MAG: hypothetical protein R3F34_17465 [Planctomycetota bacterium]
MNPSIPDRPLPNSGFAPSIRDAIEQELWLHDDPWSSYWVTPPLLNQLDDDARARWRNSANSRIEMVEALVVDELGRWLTAAGANLSGTTRQLHLDIQRAWIVCSLLATLRVRRESSAIESSASEREHNKKDLIDEFIRVVEGVTLSLLRDGPDAAGASHVYAHTRGKSLARDEWRKACSANLGAVTGYGEFTGSGKGRARAAREIVPDPLAEVAQHDPSEPIDDIDAWWATSEGRLAVAHKFREIAASIRPEASEHLARLRREALLAAAETLEVASTSDCEHPLCEVFQQRLDERLRHRSDLDRRKLSNAIGPRVTGLERKLGPLAWEALRLLAGR